MLGANQEAKGKSVGGGGGERLFYSGKGAALGVLPHLMGVNVGLEQDLCETWLSSWEQVSRVVAFCFLIRVGGILMHSATLCNRC